LPSSPDSPTAREVKRPKYDLNKSVADYRLGGPKLPRPEFFELQGERVLRRELPRKKVDVAAAFLEAEPKAKARHSLIADQWEDIASELEKVRKRCHDKKMDSAVLARVDMMCLQSSTWIGITFNDFKEWHSRRVVRRLAGITDRKRKRPLEEVASNVDPLNTSTVSPPKRELVECYGANQMDFQGFKYELTSSDSETDIDSFYT